MPDNIRIMYKRELQKIPVFGWCLKMSPYIAVDRERSREASDVLEGVVDTMSTGSSVLVFPEGTRSPDGTLGPFRRGVVAIAVRSGTPVVPVALIGTAAILPARTNRLSGGDVQLVIHAPLSVGGERTPQEEKALVGRLRSIIQETITLQP
ncbi:MAG: 1-acyl-sn-glycerol-3-phosphate acyltransferase [Ignavibacteriae bacterium]|nr:MAG: 1-acyl-sn-glycerol-3-phosphate acyltransferase [Ignavibacteriota bacterium]